MLDAIRLVDLIDGAPESLHAHELYDGHRFVDADLDGRELTGASFSECEFRDLSAHQTDLRFATFADTVFTHVKAPVFIAPRSEFRDVTIEGSRLGSAELYDASWRSVRFSNSKLGFVNLRGATLQDVLFENCTIDELDLGGSKMTRVAFENCTISSLDITRATLNHVDLRGLELLRVTGLDALKGATLNSYQVAALAPVFADRFGIKVED